MSFIRIVIEVGNDFLDPSTVVRAIPKALEISRLGIAHNLPFGDTSTDVEGLPVPVTVRFKREYHAQDPSRALGSNHADRSEHVQGADRAAGG